MIYISFALVIGIVALNKTSVLPKKCAFTIPSVILSTGCFLFNFQEIAIIIGLTTILILCIILFINKKTIELSKILICGFGAFFMMGFIPGSIGPRTTLPFIFSMLILIVALIYDMHKSKNKVKLSIIGIIIVLLLTYINYTPTLKLYQEKRPYCKYLYEQFTNAKDTKEIVINFDETLNDEQPKGRYSTIIDTVSFEQPLFYSEYFNLPEDVVYKFESQKLNLSSFNYNGKYFRNPIVIYDNVPYIPVSTILFCQGEHGRYKENTLYQDDKYIYLFNEDTSKLEKYQDNKEVLNIQTNFKTEALYSEQLTMIPIDDFCKFLDFTYSYDEENNIYHIKGNKEIREEIYS